MPGTACVGLAVLATRKLDKPIIVSVSVAVLLPGVGSVVPAGGVIVAVLVSEPSASAATEAVKAKVAVPLGSSVTLAAILPVPLELPQLEPADAVQVQEALDKPVGNVSATSALVAALGPLLRTVMVYVTELPALMVVALLVLLIARSARGASVVESVAELFALFGSVMPLGVATEAMLVSVPVAVLAMVAVTVNVAVPFTARLTVALMLPLPLGVPQLEPAAAVQVQVAFVSVFGKLSVTVALVTATGPLLLTTIV